MADLSDVTTALGQLVSASLYPPALYPGGATGASVAGIQVIVAVGWPSPQTLDDDIAAGRAQVTIYPQTLERNATRYPRAWRKVSDPVTTYTLSRSGQTISVGGAAPSPYQAQNLAAFVNGAAYLVQASPGQTPAQIAAAMQALIVVGVPGTTLSGAVITVPDGARIGPLRVGGSGTAAQEVRRQERMVQISTWAPSPDARDALVAAFDPVLGATDWLALADGSRGRIHYRGSPMTDGDQKAGIFRRDLIYSVEYPTTATQVVPETIVLEVEATVADPGGGLTVFDKSL